MTPAFWASGPSSRRTSPDAIHLGGRVQRAVTEEGQQHHLEAQRPGQGDAFGHPLRSEWIGLEVVGVQDVQARRDHRNAVLPRLGEIPLDDVRRDGRALRAAATRQADLHAVEADLPCEGEGLGVRLLAQVPVGDADLEANGRGSPAECIADERGRRHQAAPVARNERRVGSIGILQRAMYVSVVAGHGYGAASRRSTASSITAKVAHTSPNVMSRSLGQCAPIRMRAHPPSRMATHATMEMARPALRCRERHA